MLTSEFHRACERGDIEVAKQELLKDFTLDNIGSAFERVCFEGHLEFAQWILDLSTNKSATIGSEPFVRACRNRQLHVAEWLVSLKPFLFEVRQLPSGKLKPIIKDHHLAFRCACIVGDFEAAQWLLAQKPRMPISKMEFDEIFAIACINGHLEIAQWLLLVRPKIDIHSALHAATKHGQEHIIQWISTFGKVEPN
jgi:hypothetical protein